MNILCLIPLVCGIPPYVAIALAQGWTLTAMGTVGGIFVSLIVGVIEKSNNSKMDDYGWMSIIFAFYITSFSLMYFGETWIPAVPILQL